MRITHVAGLSHQEGDIAEGRHGHLSAPMVAKTA
jgi:hypothetical protein